MRFIQALSIGTASVAFVLSAIPVAAQAPGVFFRQSNRAAVMFQYQPALYCHVQNEDQMAAYGGFGQVQIVQLLRMAGAQTGDCGWPDGFYRNQNAPEVYRLFGGAGARFNLGDQICHVANEAQMAAYGGFDRVRVVQATSELGRGRNSVGDCPNP